MLTVQRLAGIAAAVAVGGIALAGAVIAGSNQPAGRLPAPTLLWSPGACVTGDYALTPCNGGRSEVVAIAPDPPGRGDCPDDTDDVLRVGRGRTACVRNFIDPHPGAPGGGGGLLRAGDCVTLDGRERPCSGPGWYGRAIAITGDPAACPPSTLDTLSGRPGAGRDTICLGPGGQVLAEGDCVAEPARDVIPRSQVARVACGSPRAWARVLSFEAGPAGCPRDSDRYLEARTARRPVTCLRLESK
ncbi:hypothetical protein HII36_24155 [Nonomuraea sp. NN258]|uniref:hypothetical protein n=1 Tax=Nonomuraea antri TaxID=2730852 RepID=UPI00156A01A8|nr:hypothetical protein [Nonomuraea antri]NRQ34900.1 hypothetical protein [Nonomuraea antri]